MEEITLENFCKNINNILYNVSNHVYFYVPSVTEVTYGENDYNQEYIDEHNIPAHDMNRAGGTIVHAAGSICVVLILDGEGDFIHERFCSDVLNYLRTKINDEQHTFLHDGNDVLIDGFKTISITETKYNACEFKKIISAIQIPINIDMETIQHVCLKPMVKIPKALSDFGITAENMLQFLEQWWNNYCEEHGINQ